MIKTILVPIDISEKDGGAAALVLAKALADTHGSKLVLLNVLEQMPGYVTAQLPSGFHEKALSQAEARLGDIARTQGVSETADVVVRHGHPSTTILEFATEIDADMIVINPHEPGLFDYFLGSVAARVVRHARCSVLVARNLEV